MSSRKAGSYWSQFFLLAVLVLAVLFAPMSYAVTSSAVVVNRLGPNVLIPISSMSDVSRIERKQLGLTIRLLGSGGFFGGYGIFYNREFKAFKAYMTNSRKLVLIECANGKKILLSPERPEEFVDSVAKRRAAAGVQDGSAYSDFDGSRGVNMGD